MTGMTRVDKQKSVIIRIVQDKLRSNTGETIGETLVGVLIAAFALLILAGAINATAKMINTSDKKIGEYYRKDAALVSQNSGSEGSVYFSVSPGSPPLETQLVYFFNNDSFSKKVVSYKKRYTI